MGGPMAANLVKAGNVVRGFDLAPPALDAARAAGVETVTDAASAARGAAVVITMLPAGKHVVGVYRDPAGPLGAAAAGTLFIDCSTIDVDSARDSHAAAAAAGMASLDAPVSGGVGGAVAGTLTFMAGGTPESFAAAKDVLAAMGRKIVHCGGPGAGQAAKLCNNMILGVSMIAVGEAFVLAEKLGLSHQALFDVASTSSGQCWSLTSYCPVPGPVPASPANSGYRPGFAAALMLKDLRLSQDAAKAVGANTELGRHAAEIFSRFVDNGHAHEDFSAVIKAIRTAP
jgi:3-hydroxyisobutyrate dehydrogenase